MPPTAVIASKPTAVSMSVFGSMDESFSPEGQSPRSHLQV
jgi:hypothetical protein